MSLKKPILLVLSLSILISSFSSTSEANHQWNLLEGIDPNPSEFKERESGKKIVYWHRRMIDGARVQKDKIVYQFDRESQELIDVIVRWREDLPAFLPELNVTEEQAESMVEGTVQLSRLYILSPESVVFSPIKPTPENPCWVVASMDEAKGLITTVIDAVEGTVLGYGIPPPHTAFSLSGPQEENPCFGVWTAWYQNAQAWFDTMGYSTETAEWPTEAQVRSHIQSKSTAMFYEFAHGGSIYFKSGCDGGFYEYTWASEIEDWISGYTKMPFTFLASCEGMCETGDDTLSYEFRKGSTEDTATVGYCHMDDPETCLANCWWEDAFGWQDALFEYMNDGHTVREAFDMANDDYEDCADNECMRFAGDENFAVVPVVFRVYDPISHWKLDETSGTIAEDSIGDNDGKLTYMDPETDWVTGKIGGALDFDGTDDYVSLYPISSLGGDSVTIAAWIKTNDLSEGLHPIVTQYDYPADGYYFYVGTDELGTDEPMFYLAGVTVQSGVSINEGQWYHLAGTNDGSNLKIYVNGELKGTPQSSSGRTGAYLYPYIGYDDYDVGSYFRGIIDDVRVYNWALDLFEIWDAMSGDAPRFRVKNSSGETVAWFDSFGNLFLKGSKYTGAGWKEPSGTNDEFIVEDGSGPIVYIDDLGDLYLKVGDVIETTPALSGADFRIQDSSGDIAVINPSNGNVYLTGELYQNPE